MEQGRLFGEVLVELGLVTPGQVQEALALQTLSGQRVGEALISLGYVTREQLQTALSEALGLNRATPLDRPPLGELLIGLKHITQDQLELALERQKRDGRKLGELLVELGYCSYKQIYEGLALQHRMVSREAKPPDAPPANKAKVVLVDDSPLAINLVKEGLAELGYDVHAFSDPFEALEQVFRLKPDIVLSDLEMPGLTGAELCRRLKNGPARAVPVIILTANDDSSTRVDGLRSGADDYVGKSASMAEIAARIDGVVRRAGETERVRRLFARYTSDAVVEEILKSGGGVVLTGEKREVTILFADIRNFTSLAESLDPEQVVDILNEVLGRLAEAVLICGGTLDKFLGDGLMAVFGAPMRRDDDPLRALQAAKMMMEAINALNATVQKEIAKGNRTEPWTLLQLGIGINSGDVVVGNLGSAQRTEYTCIGDAVNVAARLCALAGPEEILIGARTQELARTSGQFETLPPVRLKGKAQLVPLFRALWRAEAQRIAS